MTRSANFCPECGTKLQHIERHDRIRPVCPACDCTVYFDPKVAVVIFITRGDTRDEVLLIERGNDPGRGKWAMPAGFVEYDEAPEAAAIRETQEETGLDVKIDELMAVFPKLDHGLADIIIAYSATITGGTMQAGDDAEKVGWFTRESLPELVFHPSETIVGKQWRNGDL